MVRARGDEAGVADVHRDALALDVEHARALEHDVDLVVVVRLLPVRLGRDEDVDAELETRRLVDDLIPPAGRARPARSAAQAGTALARSARRGRRRGRTRRAARTRDPGPLPRAAPLRPGSSAARAPAARCG